MLSYGFRMNKGQTAATMIAGSIMAGCTTTKKETQRPYNGKIVVYQVFTRFFGNKDTTNKPRGTIGGNGVGKLKLPAVEQQGIQFRQGLPYCVVRISRCRANGECPHRNSMISPTKHSKQSNRWE